MAVADYRVNGRRIVMRNFHIPKRASELKYWYYAIARAMPQLPKFEPRFLEGADITVETIILEWKGEADCQHQLLVARKRRLG